MDGEFTIIDVVKAKRLEIDNKLTWAAGQAAQLRYEKLYGVAPKKELRRKTGGGGSHCFAIYPPEFRAEANEIVQRVADWIEASAAMQQEMF